MKKNAIVFLLCILSTTIFAQLSIVATAAQDTICQGQTVALAAEGDVFDIYSWTPNTWITSPSTANPTVTPPTTTTYTVIGSSLGSSVISNGDFSVGNSGFTTEYLYGPNTSGGQWGDLSDEGTYAVVTNPNIAHTNFANCDDHTTGFGNMLVVNGSAVLNQEVWCQTIDVQENTTYQFSTWITSVVGDNPAELQFSINETLLGSTFIAPSGTCNWEQFFQTWDSNNNTNVEICIVNQNIAVGGNDFALDDISFSPVLIEESAVTVYVSEISGVIVAQTSVGCDGSLGTASVVINGGFEPYIYSWDNGEITEVAINLSGGNHTLTVTDAVGCATIVNVNIDAPQNPVIQDVIVQSTTCGFVNGILEVLVEPGNEPFEYSIDGVNFQDENVFMEVASGTFFVVVEDAGGCTGAYQVIVEGSESISLEINTPAGVDLCGDLSVLLDAGDFENYEWSNGETSASITVEVDNEYSVIVIDENGCVDTASIEIEACGGWEMPNVFTPDGDGLNDTFGPVVTGNNAEVIGFKIYNRWGNLVHDEKIPWDGTIDGNPHPTGVLIYMIKIETNNGVEQMSGDVTLIR
jgi:gliding motility-associated-like protein